MLKTALSAAACLALTTTACFAVEVAKGVEVAAPPEAVWAAIGDFCGIGQWHPAVETCTLSEKGEKPIRTLSLKGGGTIVEEQLSRSDETMNYVYTILESPLPVENYLSTIAVTPGGKGSRITWFGTFQAKGVPDAKAEEVITGIYEAGLAALAKTGR